MTKVRRFVNNINHIASVLSKHLSYETQLDLYHCIQILNTWIFLALNTIAKLSENLLPLESYVDSDSTCNILEVIGKLENRRWPAAIFDFGVVMITKSSEENIKFDDCRCKKLKAVDINKFQDGDRPPCWNM